MFSFGQKHADLTEKNCAPGAGAYSPNWRPTCASAPAFTIGARRRQKSPGEETPGAGTYDMPEICHGPAFSLSSRHAGSRGA